MLPIGSELAVESFDFDVWIGFERVFQVFPFWNWAAGLLGRSFHVDNPNSWINDLQTKEPAIIRGQPRSEEHTSELQSHSDLFSFLHDALPISYLNAAHWLRIGGREF